MREHQGQLLTTGAYSCICEYNAELTACSYLFGNRAPHLAICLVRTALRQC